MRSAPLSGVVFRDLGDAATTDLALAWRTDGESPLVRKVLDVLEDGGMFDSDEPLEVAP